MLVEKLLGKKVRVAKRGEESGKLPSARASADKVLVFLMSEKVGKHEVLEAIGLSHWDLSGYAGPIGEEEDE